MEHVYYWKTPPTQFEIVGFILPTTVQFFKMLKANLVEVGRDQSVKRVSDDEELCGVVQGFPSVSLLARHWVFPEQQKNIFYNPKSKYCIRVRIVKFNKKSS